jgi:O-antigen ligase
MLVTTRFDHRAARTTTLAAAVRAVLLTLLLVGSLYPISSISLVLVAALILMPFALWTMVAGLPTLHRSCCLVVLLATLVAVPTYLDPPHSEYGQAKVSSFLTLTLFTAVVAILVRDRADLIMWARVWVVSGVLLAVVALTGGVDAVGRATGEDGGNPIWLARAIGSPIIAVLWLTYQRLMPRWLACAIGALLLAALLATGSRGPFGGVVIGSIVVLAATSARDRTARIITAAALSASLVYVLVSLQLFTDSRIGEFVSDPGGSAGSSGRSELAGPTIDIILDHPWGVGFGNWRLYAPIGPHRYPHNLWLEVLSEAGWIVGLTLVLLVVRIIIGLWKASRTDPSAALMLGLLTVEVASVSVSGDLNARTFFFMLTLGYVVWCWIRTAPRSSTGPGPSAAVSRGRPRLPVSDQLAADPG